MVLRAPYGVIASGGDDEGSLDASDITQSYRVPEEDGIITVEATVPEGLVVEHYAALLRAHEPFEVLWHRIHETWDSDAGEEFRACGSLNSAAAILDHLEEYQTASVRNGFVTVTAYAKDGATNVNISHHKTLVVMTRSQERADMLVATLKDLGYGSSCFFMSIDRRIYHRHCNDPAGPDQVSLLTQLEEDGFEARKPGATSDSSTELGGA